ncbi:MAG TPA: class I SAM-dependent methyltransferase [Dehalococcoidia bacterium]|jgi:SAM-dependent methyltransferase|nr:class I SAM-dependent methyltransferase [Dehalococcoidia bacterium]
MTGSKQLPPDFLAYVRSLEDAYLASDDPVQQSGFHGGPERWRAEREPILRAVDGDGSFLDVGCANGYLLECLVHWARERAIALDPYGVDVGPRLIAEARRRLPAFADNFWVANAWEWQPPRRFRYVYTLNDCVPPDLLREYVLRLLDRIVEPGGRLIVGSYGSRSRCEPPLDIAEALASFGLDVVGRAHGGEPPITALAWVNNA